MIKAILKALLKFVKEWREELFSIPLAFVIYCISPYILRLLDPTAATYDSGIFQIILFTLVSMLLYNGLAWMGLKQMFPEIFNYFQHAFKFDFLNLEPWQKIKVALLVWGFLLASFIFLSRVL